MRFIAYDADGVPALGILVGDDVVVAADLAATLPPALREAVATARDVADIAGLPGVVEALGAALESGSPRRLPIADVRLVAPIVRPGRVIGVGLNYRSHAEEQGAKIPRQPILFAKWSDSVVGPDAVVALPYAEAQVDYECEVTVVIGRGGRDIPVGSALDHVFGVTAMNDLSDRNAQLAERQWTRAKSFDGFSPLGPTVVTLDETGPLDGLALGTSVNGEVVQQGDTSDLIFDIPTLVAFASQGTTLCPGDVIATGTPSGVAFVKDPAPFLQPGDVVAVTVEHVGTLTTTIGPIAGGRS